MLWPAFAPPQHRSTLRRQLNIAHHSVKTCNRLSLPIDLRFAVHPPEPGLSCRRLTRANGRKSIAFSGNEANKSFRKNFEFVMYARPTINAGERQVNGAVCSNCTLRNDNWVFTIRYAKQLADAQEHELLPPRLCLPHMKVVNKSRTQAWKGWRRIGCDLKPPSTHRGCSRSCAVGTPSTSVPSKGHALSVQDLSEPVACPPRTPHR